METINWTMCPETFSKVIYETNNYALVVTPIEWITKAIELGNSMGAYCIVHKEYRVVESTGSSIHIMLKAINVFETNLEDIQKQLKEESHNAFTIVKFPKDDSQQLPVERD